MGRTEGNLMFLGVIPWHCLQHFVCLFYVFYEVDSLAGLELGWPPSPSGQTLSSFLCWACRCAFPYLTVPLCGSQNRTQALMLEWQALHLSCLPTLFIHILIPLVFKKSTEYALLKLPSYSCQDYILSHRIKQNKFKSI